MGEDEEEADGVRERLMIEARGGKRGRGRRRVWIKCGGVNEKNEEDSHDEGKERKG